MTKVLFRVGDTDPVIEDVQRWLLSPTVDGVFSDDLQVRVRGFQWIHNLPTHGLLDEETLSILRGDG